MLNGRDYVAVVRITNRSGDVLAAVGHTCERVPRDVLESLERRGKIRRSPRPVRVVPEREGG